MHLEILVEDKSGKRMLDKLVPRIVGGQVTFQVISFKGIGRIPKNLAQAPNPRIHTLLEHLPRMLRAYGRSYSAGYPGAVIVVCDLDDKCRKEFRRQLVAMLRAVHPRPRTRFCLAIEEGEAWLLGDIPAVVQAYPQARTDVLNSYTNDSICDTWELLANAVYPGWRGGFEETGMASCGQGKIEVGGQDFAENERRGKRVTELSVFSGGNEVAERSAESAAARVIIRWNLLLAYRPQAVSRRPLYGTYVTH